MSVTGGKTMIQLYFIAGVITMLALIPWLRSRLRCAMTNNDRMLWWLTWLFAFVAWPGHVAGIIHERLYLRRAIRRVRGNG